jgi:hypothetical protein
VPLPLDESDAIGVRRYQLTVIAANVVDAVESAGGWMCDRARAGWDVQVVLTDPDDTRPLAILGASVGELGGDLDGDLADVVRNAAQGGALAVSAHVLADESLRADVLGVVKRGLVEVTAWGPGCLTQFGRKADPVEHKLSSAARAFKARALGVASESTSPVAGTETFFSLGADALRLYSL